MFDRKYPLRKRTHLLVAILLFLTFYSLTNLKDFYNHDNVYNFTHYFAFTALHLAGTLLVVILLKIITSIRQHDNGKNQERKA